MQKILFLLIVVGFTCNAQTFTRKTFDYNTLENSPGCDEKMLTMLDGALVKINQNDSEGALTLSKGIYDGDKSCPEIYQVYGESLFRSGQLLEGIAVIDQGIEKFGSNSNLIRSRYVLSIELFEVGTGRKNVDGNAVYNAANKLPYDEAQFKSENLKSAQHDLEYLIAKFPDSLGEAYTLGRIYQINGESEKSRAIFEKLKKNNQYQYGAVMNIAELSILAENYDAAIAELEALVLKYPKAPQAYRKLSETYKAKGDAKNASHFDKKAMYYEYVPDFTDLAYSESNYNLLMLFGGEDTDAKEKFAKLSEIDKAGNTDFTADICLTILKLHANHGNGLEEEAVKILTRIGKPAISKVHKLFLDNISTCTVGGLAEIMATVKDESSWQIMADYLPYLSTMPMTIIPPDVPTQIVRFDKQRGTKEVLKIIKELLEKEKHAEHMPFSAYTFYGALKGTKQKDLIKMAREIGYSNHEIAALKAKIKE